MTRKIADCLEVGLQEQTALLQNAQDAGFLVRSPESALANLWTARKVLRRLVDHERLHPRYIAKVLQAHSELGKVY
ncbi:MAG: hypothetical protein ACP5JW_04175 [Candidatus Bathyarchaeia archaeon]